MSRIRRTDDARGYLFGRRPVRQPEVHIYIYITDGASTVVVGRRLESSGRYFRGRFVSRRRRRRAFERSRPGTVTTGHGHAGYERQARGRGNLVFYSKRARGRGNLVFYNRRARVCPLSLSVKYARRRLRARPTYGTTTRISGRSIYGITFDSDDLPPSRLNVRRSDGNFCRICIYRPSAPVVPVVWGPGRFSSFRFRRRLLSE